jgi:2,3-bisphosphoglycerate-independent phosphoglycerate mutase
VVSGSEHARGIVLVIPDGAAQPPRPGKPTAFEAARTPVLDELASTGAVARVATTPHGLPAGSETGIPSLLGAPPRRRVGRGWVDAAAYDVALPDGLIPWRADLLYRSGRRASIRQARDVCAHLGPGAHALAGHRLLLLATERPADRRLLGLHLRVWPGGARLEGRVPLDTVVVCARGAAAGCARLLGARVVIPPGATGDLDTDLRAKAQAAVAALAAGAERVVVHVGAPDEAAHRRQPEAVVGVLERLDRELLGPLRDTVGALGGRLGVCPDHGTDPHSGRHDPAPVPAVVWGAGVPAVGPGRLSERVVQHIPPVAPSALLAAGEPARAPSPKRSLVPVGGAP